MKTNDKSLYICLDGTIADTLESMAYVANEIMEKFSLKPQPTDNFRYYSGEGADMLIRRCLIDAGDPELVHYEEVRNFIAGNLMKIRCISCAI